MKLFLKSNLCYGLNHEQALTKTEDGKNVLSLVKENNNEVTNLKFIFDKDVDKNIIKSKGGLISGIDIVKENDNVYRIVESDSEKEEKCIYSLLREKCIYAFLRDPHIIPSDVFISKKFCEKITVMEKIFFELLEPDFGYYQVRMYLVKIELNPYEYFQVYYAPNNPELLKYYDIFFKDFVTIGEYYTVDCFRQTSLIYDKNEYISLSEI